MGRRKPFIDKKKAATYHLMHRPTEGIPGMGGDDGERTFVRVDKNWDPDEEDDLEDDLFADDEDIPDKQLMERDEMTRHEILELGFPDDGYDYNQHLRSIGNNGGDTMFVPSKPAERRALAVDKRAYDASRLASVPADAFDPEASLAPAKGASAKPRAEEGTLSHELAQLELAMDSDLEEEEDWVLNDDFVANALQLGAGEEAGASSSSRGFKFATRDDEQAGSSTGPAAGAAARGQAAEKQEEGGDDDCDDDYAGLSSSDDDEDASSDAEPARTHPGASRAAGEHAQPSVLESAFERLAMDYDSDDIGELEEDQRARGKNDVAAFAHVLDEFLDEKKLDSELDNGQYIPIGKGVAADPKLQAAVFAEALEKTKALGAGIEENDKRGVKEVQKILPEYEKVAIEEKWDVETIVSTYSNLDNHPGLIRSDGYKPRSSASSRGVPAAPLDASTAARPQIKLSRKQGLPVDYLPWKSTSADSKMGAIEEGGSARGDEEMPEGEEEEEELAPLPAAASCAVVDLQRHKGETAEEKKARKAAVKEARREARVSKKANKVAVKEEGKKAAAVGGGVRQSIMVL